MTMQTELDFEATARLKDPQTSHDAAAKVTRTGGVAKQREKCLAAVREFPGLTAAEIAVKVGYERHVPSRRLPELREKSLVRNGTDRVCEVTGNVSMTWWPVS